MKTKALLLGFACVMLANHPHAQRMQSTAADAWPARSILFDEGWRFHRGGAQRAEQPGFDDSGWRAINLPHDWSIEDLPGTASPFSPDAIGQVSTGFATGGTGWYRKTFMPPAAAAGRRVVLVFDGVYMNADVWVNGVSVGSHAYGYTSFWWDITSRMKPGAANVIAVKVRNEGENSRWYSGSGIYRHVWLKVIDPVHVAQWGTAITTTDATAASARVHVVTKVDNQSDGAAAVTLTTRLVSARGEEAGTATSAQTIAPGATSEFSQDIMVAGPALWSPESPAMYTAISEVRSSGRVLDRAETPFGIRSVVFDATRGFVLNGTPMKLRGGCIHHDHGPLGSASYDRAEERRIELMKASGFNAIRCAHNPPAPALLDAADRLGMIVIDEAFDMWSDPKNPHDYHLFFDRWWALDLESMIARDRNHPSVVAWSIGNEIPGMDDPRVVQTARALAAYVRKADPSRPVLAAVNNLNPKKDPFFAAVDIAGYNYGSGGDHSKEAIFSTDHGRVPSRVMLQTESYPLEAFRSWMDVLDHPWLLGDFVWTAVDYLGEASIGWRGYFQERRFYPWTLAFCGDIDTCGWKRPQSYYRDALWKADQLAIVVTPPAPSFDQNPDRMAWSKWHWLDAVADWNWAGHEGRPLEVTAYSSCDEVELLLDDVSLGRRNTNRASEFKASWRVPYRSGTLKAVGYRSGRGVRTAVLRTAGAVSKLVAMADRDRLEASGQDLSYVTVELQDAGGARHPKAEHLLSFAIDGAGVIAAVGNANPMSVESYQRPERKAWQGRCLVIVRSARTPGDIRLTISSAGLPSTSITIRAAAPSAQPSTITLTTPPS
jgi:beta-galactosidase